MAFSIVRNVPQDELPFGQRYFPGRKRELAAPASPHAGHPFAFRPNAFEAKLRVQLRNIRHQRNVGAVKGVSVQPGDQLLHHQPPKALSLVSRIDGDVDNVEINRAVADDAPHGDRRPLPEDMYAITAARQPGSGAFQGARRHTRYLSQVAKRFGGGHLLDHGIFNGHALVSWLRGDKSRERCAAKGKKKPALTQR